MTFIPPILSSDHPNPSYATQEYAMLCDGVVCYHCYAMLCYVRIVGAEGLDQQCTCMPMIMSQAPSAPLSLNPQTRGALDA